jgi:hypothetical protein
VRAIEPLGRRNTSAPGQAMEFRIWAELIQQSIGGLHVFLPLMDRGLDGIIHRFRDGEYIPVQIKSRGATVEGVVEIVIRGTSLVDDHALLIAGLFTDEGLGPMLLVVDERTFKRLAARVIAEGHEVFSAAFSMHPTKGSHWLPYLVPRDLLAERLLGARPSDSVAEEPPVQEGLEPRDRHNQWLGFLGESEVIRQLAQSPRLDLFRPFPDLEMVEVLARDNMTGNFAGIQVKTATVAELYHEAHIHVHKATLSLAATSWLVALAWRHEERAFHAECLLIPTADLPKVAFDDGTSMVINFHPKSPERTKLDPYRHRLSELGTLVERIVEA